MAVIQGFNCPDDLYFHDEHAWAKVEGDKVRVGMSEFFAKQAGNIVYIDLPMEGDELEAGETCGKLQSSKWVSKLISPIGGEVVEVNTEFDSDSTLINQDPYGKGWIMVLAPADKDADLAKLHHGNDAVTKWIQGQIERAEKEKKK
jgi:glycine cleavage system H protein